MDPESLPGYNEDGTLTDARLQFTMDCVDCMVCGRQGTDTHEIARGAYRKQAVKQRCAWLRLCRECHNAMDDYSEWPIARQLALKKLQDPQYYDRQAVNRLRGRHDNAITEGEVEAYTVRN